MDFLLSPKLLVPSIVVLLVLFLMLLTKIVEKKRDKHTRAEVVLRHAHVPLQIALILALLYLVFELLSIHWTSNLILDQTYTIVMIIGFGYLGIKCMGLVTSLILQRYNLQIQDNYYARTIHTRIRVIKRLVKAMIIAIVILAVLMTFQSIRAQGINILASAGLLSIIVGLAAQKTIGNFFAGLQIAIAQPMRVEDVVVVENEWGTIEEIHLTYVVVKLWDLRRMILPISYFTDHIFQNWTQKTADLLGTVYLYVDFAMPLQPIRDELDRILDGNKLWDKRVKVVQIFEILEHAMQLRILASASNSGTAFDLRCDIRERLMTFMQKNYPNYLPRMRAEIIQEPCKPIETVEEPPSEPVRSPAPTLSPNPKPMTPEEKK